ncbi:hypothetical protein INR49_002233 [Caranx melampygus]|nr:hypothetical protein INR49_002233 [Caranx melampygus]
MFFWGTTQAKRFVAETSLKSDTYSCTDMSGTKRKKVTGQSVKEKSCAGMRTRLNCHKNKNRAEYKQLRSAPPQCQTSVFLISYMFIRPSRPSISVSDLQWSGAGRLSDNPLSIILVLYQHHRCQFHHLTTGEAATPDTSGL